jgi:hypothetical protein
MRSRHNGRIILKLILNKWVWILYASASEKRTLGTYGDNFEGRVLKLVGNNCGFVGSGVI